MSDDQSKVPLITNLHNAPDNVDLDGDHVGATWRVLTPLMRERGGRLGVAWNKVPPGRTACPFHTHQREDEVFYVLSGRGVLRYGDNLVDLRAGDCVSCPAGTGIAHQIANDSDEDLVYLSIGPHDPHEVCSYPDSNKVFVRSLGTVGRLERTEYMDHEPDPPAIFSQIEAWRSQRDDGSDGPAPSE